MKNEDIMASSPLATRARRTSSCRAITAAVIIGWLAFFVPIQITQKLLLTQQQQQHQQQPAGAVIKNDERSAASNNNIINNNDYDYAYAPIIVAAGMGTTGTHLMFDATCAMNIPSVHYRLNCHLLHAENNTATTATITAAIATNNTRYHKAEDYYKTLLEHHRQLTRMMLTMQDMTSSPIVATAADNNNNNFMTPLQFKQKVLHHLEEIIAWVYHHHKEDNDEGGGGGITLALHDAPYPLLISSILKLVQKYFGNKTKPIILLSERNPNEWIVRRTMLHWRHTYVCRESIVLLDNSRMSHAIMSRSLEGGAFDILGCIDKAQQQQQQHEQKQQQLTRDDILYNLKEVQRLNQTQYVVDSMNQYQNAIRDLAVFNYNMFERSSNNNRTSVEDLVQMIKNAMLEKRITWLL